MVSRQEIQATCDDIVREFAPLQVILFGSYGYGSPTEDSDVDLLVVMAIPESETRRQASEIRRRIPQRFPMDLLVRSPEEIAYRLLYNDWFLNYHSSHPIHDAICFHAQQCIEKYLKAWLQETNIPFTRTHDLERLLSLILPTLPDWEVWQPDFSTISEHAVDFRYPGKEATATDAQHAIEICIRVRQAVREQLELPSNL